MIDWILATACGFVLNLIIMKTAQWWKTHQIEVKQDIKKVPGLEGIIHCGIWFAENFKATKDGPAKFKIAKDWITGEVMLLPVPPYVKATIIKVLPDLLQKAFDALPNPEVSVVSKDVANSIPTATQQPVQSTNPILAEAPKVIG